MYKALNLTKNQLNSKAVYLGANDSSKGHFSPCIEPFLLVVFLIVFRRLASAKERCKQRALVGIDKIKKKINF